MDLQAQFQDWFDRGLAHMRQQASRCIMANGSCAYRGRTERDNLPGACFVGALLDEEGLSNWGNHSGTCNRSITRHLLPADMRRNSGFVDRANKFLVDCQGSLHDEIQGEDTPLKRKEFLAELEIGARSVADHYNLAYIPPEEVTHG